MGTLLRQSSRSQQPGGERLHFCHSKVQTCPFSFPETSWPTKQVSAWKWELCRCFSLEERSAGDQLWKNITEIDKFCCNLCVGMVMSKSNFVCEESEDLIFQFKQKLEDQSSWQPFHFTVIQQLETICIYGLIKLRTSGVHGSVYNKVLDVSGQYEELFLLQVLREAVKNKTLPPHISLSDMWTAMRKFRPLYVRELCYSGFPQIPSYIVRWELLHKKKSLGCLGDGLFGIMMEDFHRLEIRLQLSDIWKIWWRTLLSWWAQYLIVHPQISSGPEAFLAFTFFIRSLTHPWLMTDRRVYPVWEDYDGLKGHGHGFQTASNKGQRH